MLICVLFFLQRLGRVGAGGAEASHGYYADGDCEDQREDCREDPERHRYTVGELLKPSASKHPCERGGDAEA